MSRPEGSTTRAFIPYQTPLVDIWLVKDDWTWKPVRSGYAKIEDGRAVYPLERTRLELQQLPDTPTLRLTYEQVEALRDELAGWERP